jgi:hypothetical protein
MRSKPMILVALLLAAFVINLDTTLVNVSIMGAVSRRQAGVGSAVNDTTRLLGGTLGVAVIGSVYASLYGSRLTASLPAVLPRGLSAIAHQSLGAAYAVSGQIAAAGHGALGQTIHTAATNAFLHGLSISCLVAGGVAAAGAVLAVVFLPAQPASPAVTMPSGSSAHARTPAEESARSLVAGATRWRTGGPGGPWRGGARAT